MAEDIKKTENAAEMDWDSPIEADVGSANLPPIGEYGFTVIELEKTFSSNGNRMAKVTLELDQSGQFWKVYDNLVLTDKTAWKLAQFFECLGLKKKGEKLEKMPWDKVLNETGRVKIKHETYQGKESCKVDQYLITEASQAPKAPDTSEFPFEV